MARKASINQKLSSDIAVPSTDLFIYGEIGESIWTDNYITSADVAQALTSIPDDHRINLHINSIGGKVGEGLAIYNLLRKRGKVRTYVDGYAISIASVIAMAGDERISPASSIWMVHSPASGVYGTAKRLREEADALDIHLQAVLPIYTERTGLSEEEIMQMLEGDTWFAGRDAVDKGFATALSEDDVQVDRVLPQQYKDFFKQEEKKLASLGWSFAPYQVAACARPLLSNEIPVQRVQTLDPTSGTDDQSTQEINLMATNADAQLNEQVTQMSAEMANLRASLSSAEQELAQAKADMAQLKVTNQYYQLRSEAIQLYALENKLTQEDFEVDFCAQAEDGLARLAAMDNETARAELLSLDRTLRRAAMRNPLDRLSQTDAAMVNNGSLQSLKADGNSGRRVLPTQEASETNEQKAKADAFLSRYQPRKVGRN